MFVNFRVLDSSMCYRKQQQKPVDAQAPAHGLRAAGVGRARTQGRGEGVARSAAPRADGSGDVELAKGTVLTPVSCHLP